MLNAKTDQTLKGFGLPPLTFSLSQRAVQLSADIYLTKGELETKYPTAIIREAGCDRVMIVKNSELRIVNSETSQSRLVGTAEIHNSQFNIQNSLFIVFMGTHDLRSLISDFDVKRKSIGGGREVHSGFEAGVEELWPGILAALSAFSLQPSALIWTGHSRGGSQAILAADRWEAVTSDQWPVTSSSHSDSLTTNHSPPTTAFVLPIAPARPGNAAFRDRYNYRLGHRTFCYQHGADIVPWEPPYVLGNRGVGHRIFFPDLKEETAESAEGGNAECRMQNAESPRPPRPPVRILDPSLLQLAWTCAALTLRGWVQLPPQLEQLADHHVATYEALLNPRLKAKC